MDWSSILSIIMAILVAVGLPLAFRKRRKGGPGKRQELCQHLQEIGVKAYTVEAGGEQEKIGQKRSWGEKSVGIIELRNRNIDFINIIGVASQYGTQHFIDYLVKTPNIIEKQTLKKTRLVRKKSSPLRGKVVAIEWRGDESLAQRLNFDYKLEGKLLKADPKDLQGSICISPEPKHGYARIRTAYSLPSSEAFEAMDIIAKHVKLW